MSYDITYYGIEGQPIPYARVQRLLDSKWWDETGIQWVDSPSATCNVNLIEDSTMVGKYIGSANFTASNGGVYRITVYDNAGVMLARNNIVYNSNQMTALQIINEVQRQLRLPKSALITEPHAQLLLSFINEVLVDYMLEFTTWDELKVSGSFAVKAGVSVYMVAPVNGGKVDTILNLQIAGDQPLDNLNGEAFRAYSRAQADQHQPYVYRHFGRSGGGILIEVSPVPDGFYQVDYELLQKPTKLVNAADVPMLDEDTIILGVKYLAKKDQGDDFAAELATFQSKLALMGGNQSGSSYGDVEFL